MNKSMESYCVSVEGQDLLFSAGHFIVIEPGIIEPLHGHDFFVRLDFLSSEKLGAEGYLIDFNLLRRELKKIISAWDHRTLLPGDNPEIELNVQPDQIELTYRGKRWLFPADDCVVLPIVNTTSELIAHEIGARLLKQLAQIESTAVARPARLQVELSESTGNRTTVTLDI
jgi:6-pyruvoyltetrahydropterin/6-carboxytetrahydropterin synthase